MVFVVLIHLVGMQSGVLGPKISGAGAGVRGKTGSGEQDGKRELRVRETRGLLTGLAQK